MDLSAPSRHGTALTRRLRAIRRSPTAITSIGPSRPSASASTGRRFGSGAAVHESFKGPPTRRRRTVLLRQRVAGPPR